jgi:hypothetical protein
MGTPSQTLDRTLILWTCDTCSGPITAIEEGWVEWLAGIDQGITRLTGLKLVHRLVTRRGDATGYGCRYDAHREFHENDRLVEGLPLARFVGRDGLMLLLSLFAAGDLPLTDVLELTKRVQVPGYERTRPLFNEAITEGVITPSIGPGFYLQWEIRTVLNWAGGNTEL